MVACIGGVLALGAFLSFFAVRPEDARANSQAPVAEYSFDEEPVEGTVEDLTGDGHTATIEGATWTGHGRYGGAMEFDGEDDCLSVESDAELQMTEEFTLEAWVRPESEGLDAIITQEDETAGEAEDPFAFSFLSGDEEEEGPRLWIRGTEGGPRAGVGGEAIPEDAWSHLAVTDDGARLRFYVDGALEGTTAAIPVTAAHGPLTIGCLKLYGNHFKGRIDELRVYNRALDSAEVDTDMEAPIATPKAGPVAEYSFDEEPVEGTVEDLTGDGHTATIEGATWTGHGRYGGAMEFDGTDDVLKIPSSPELSFTEEFTLEAWVRPDEAREWSPVIDKIIGDGKSPHALSYWLFAGGSKAGAPDAGLEYAAGEGYSVGSECLPSHTWSHLALTWDGAKLRLYVNGEKVSETSAPRPPVTTEGDLEIGGSTELGDFFMGRIDELRVYERALDGAEVDADMEAPIQTPKAGPVAEYSFDEGEGETVEDVSGDGHTATIEGAEWTTHGKYGGAMDFDAAKHDVLTVPTSPELDLDEFTLEAWVRPSEAVEALTPILDKTDTGGYGYSLFAGGDEAAFLEGFITKEEWVERYAVGGPLTPDTWTHVAVTNDGAHMRLYVNGELVDERSGDDVLAGGEAPLQIGGEQSFAPAGYFDGRIDEVRVYDRALDGAEVQADMEAPIETPKRGPVAEWSFDEEPVEGAAEDVTGDGHEATVEGATWTEHGKYGGAMEFDGTDDVLKIPGSPELSFTEEFTLEAWVRPDEPREWSPVIDKIIGDGKSPHALSYWLFAGGSNPGHPYGGLEYAAGEGYSVGSGCLPSHTWSHLALTWDGAKLRLYVNGEKVSETSAPRPPVTTEGDLEIGGSTELGDFFMGRIDELRVYERALSAGEATDVEGPRFPAPFQVTAATVPNPLAAGPAARTTFFFPAAIDPLLPNGHPGTGTSTYTYRYALNEEAFGEWHDTSQPGFTIAEAEEEAKITIQVYATDRVGNEGAAETDTVIVPDALVVPEESAEELFDEEAGKTGVEFGVEGFSAGESMSAGALSPLAEEEAKFTICGGGFDYIHESHHERKLHGRRRVNVEAEFHCNGDLGISEGEAVVILVFSPHDHPNKMIWVGQSETRYFSGLPPIGPFKRAANGPCIFERGVYHALGYIRAVWEPPAVEPESEEEGSISAENPCL